eukprot:3351684-Rhodomonas_salina.1
MFLARDLGVYLPTYTAKSNTKNRCGRYLLCEIKYNNFLSTVHSPVPYPQPTIKGPETNRVPSAER